MSEVHGDIFTGNASEYDDSRFINYSTLAGMDPITLTIKEVIGLKPDFKFENGRTLGKKTLVLKFEKTPKAMKLNSTNRRILQKILGNKCADWPGNKITIYGDPDVMFGGKRVGGVVVKG